MIAENPLALAYILPADVFFLHSDKEGMALPKTGHEIQEAQPAAPAETHTAPVALAAVPQAAEVAAIPAANLVKTAAVEVDAPLPPAAANPVAPVFAYKGGFKQKFLVIVNYPDIDLMEPAHLTALESTIKRKEIGLDDVAIFNIGRYPGTDIKAIGRFFKPKRMLLLGSDSFPVGLAAQPLNQLTLLGTCQLLYSHNFTQMMANRELVKTFWEQMKML